ncbi:hypothetical protein H4582DRAFT_2103866 [Lactarius indigo]|nr:hypothetical protein H4582DRAFT_2103866 [Lactarius indigo]
MDQVIIVIGARGAQPRDDDAARRRRTLWLARRTSTPAIEELCLRVVGRPHPPAFCNADHIRAHVGEATEPRELCIAQCTVVQQHCRGTPIAGYRGGGACAWRVDRARAGARR